MTGPAWAGLLLAVAAAGAAPVASRLPAALAEADALYARRAEGAPGAVAEPARIDAAIAVYRRLARDAPEDAGAVFRLLRALHFKGAFTGATEAQRKTAFDEGRRLGQAFVDALERKLRGQSAPERLAALRLVPDAAEVYYWTAACWGQWALLRGTFAAARAGVAGKIRDLAETVLALDPALEEGGADRVLGRLHAEAPRIPFFTGWVSRPDALAHLRRSHAIAPRNRVTRFFLAEAILDHDKGRAAEARGLLQSCLDEPPRPEYLVEDRHYAELARARLAGRR